VCTGEMTEELILSGADIVKVGIGPGSVCTTRRMTGVGYPQLSAIIECADAAHGLEGHICADGGCTTPGDIAKAFGGGADFVMLGGMFAGHDESGGELVERGGAKFRSFYGMSSKAAMEKYAGGVAEYRAAEGKEVLVPHRGPVAATASEILGEASRAVEAHDVRARHATAERGVRKGLNRPPRFAARPYNCRLRSRTGDGTPLPAGAWRSCARGSRPRVRITVSSRLPPPGGISSKSRARSAATSTRRSTAC
jgi:IMP dehydrogenase/GMP reductase